jgi:septum formation protein
MATSMQVEPLVRASQSAARAAVLRGAGVAFEARPARVDEAAVKAAGKAEGASAEDVAFVLASMKAERVRAPGQLVVGADQLLVCGDEWFDKPDSVEAARRQLLLLRGRTHQLVTAVVCMKDGSEIWRHVARPVLAMRSFSDAFLDAYLAAEGERVTESVGGYRLEGPGAQLFDRVEGEFAAILGLPLLPLLGFLRQHGVLLA